MVGRVGGGESDGAARRGQACHIVGHDGIAVEGNIKADLLGAKNAVENIHFKVRARTFEEDMIVADGGAAFILGERGSKTVCRDC